MSEMKAVKIEKVSLNIGVGEAGDNLKKAQDLMQRLTNRKPITTKGKKKIPGLGVRPGLPIGVKVTLREDFDDLIKRLLEANENVLKNSSFDGRCINFGIEEYLHIPGVEYDPSIGIMGLNVTIVLQRPGYRVNKRRLKKSKVGQKHLISSEESMEFMKKNYGVEIK